MIEIELFEKGGTTEAFLNELKELVAHAFETRFSDEDWEHGLGGIHISVRESGKLVSHAAVIPRRLYIGKEVYSCGYVEAVATLPNCQRRGFASLAVGEANKLIKNDYEVGALSSSGKGFYRNLGWEDWDGPSYVLTNGEWIRSASEDHGIMVLRTDHLSKLDLRSRIACEARSGDSW